MFRSGIQSQTSFLCGRYIFSTIAVFSILRILRIYILNFDQIYFPVSSLLIYFLSESPPSQLHVFSFPLILSVSVSLNTLTSPHAACVLMGEEPLHGQHLKCSISKNTESPPLCRGGISWVFFLHVVIFG